MNQDRDWLMINEIFLLDCPNQLKQVVNSTHSTTENIYIYSRKVICILKFSLVILFKNILRYYLHSFNYKFLCCAFHVPETEFKVEHYKAEVKKTYIYIQSGSSQLETTLPPPPQGTFKYLETISDVRIREG